MQSPSKPSPKASPKLKASKKAVEAEKHPRSPQKQSSPNPAPPKRLKGKQEDPDQQKQIDELKEARCVQLLAVGDACVNHLGYVGQPEDDGRDGQVTRSCQQGQEDIDANATAQSSCAISGTRSPAHKPRQKHQPVVQLRARPTSARGHPRRPQSFNACAACARSSQVANAQFPKAFT